MFDFLEGQSVSSIVLLGVMMGLMLVCIVMIPVSFKWHAEYKKECESVGGHILYMRKSNDLCIKDGLIIELRK